MSVFVQFIVYLVLGFGIVENSVAALESHHLVVGDKFVLKKTGPLWIENSKILKAEEANGGITLKAIGQGSSLLKQNNQVYSFSVLSPKQYRTFEALEAASRNTLGLKAEYKNGSVVLGQKIYRFQDWKKVFDTCMATGCEYLMTAEVPPQRTEFFSREIANLAKQSALPPQNIHWDKTPSIQLSNKDPQAQRLKIFYQALGFKIVEDSEAISMAPLVRLQITVAEVRRREFQKLGIQWPGSLNAQTLPKPEIDYSSATGAIHFLEENGFGRTLASPTVLCRSGKEAEFFAGGEIPIKNVTHKSKNVEWKKYGIILKFKPLADFSGKMSLDIETEVSSLDLSSAIEGVPGILVNRIKSHFDLREPRTILLSGLIRNDNGQSSSGLPGLSQIPILGSLFSSKDFRESRTELVVLVRPEIDNGESPL